MKSRILLICLCCLLLSPPLWASSPVETSEGALGGDINLLDGDIDLLDDGSSEDEVDLLDDGSSEDEVDLLDDGASEEDIDLFESEASSDSSSAEDFDAIDLSAVHIDSVGTESTDRWWDVDGSLSSELGYRFEKQRETSEPQRNFGQGPTLVKWRHTLQVNGQVQLSDSWKWVVEGWGFYDSAYSQRGRNDFDDNTLETYESDAELREFWVGGPLTSWMDLRFGRQIVVWGEADVETATDVLNPRDLREPFLTDVEDQRLAVTMLKADFYPTLNSTLSVIVIPEFRPELLPPATSDFRVLPPSVDLDDADLPNNGPENWEYGLRYKFTVGSGDVSLLAAQVFDDRFHLEFEGGQPKLRHERVEVWGVNANYASGNFVYKLEGVYNVGRRLGVRGDVLQQRLNQGITEVTEEKDEMGMNVGFDYSGINDLTLTLEFGATHIVDHEAELTDRENNQNAAVRAAYTLFNEQLTLEYFGVTYSDDDGTFHRITGDYDFTDTFHVFTSVAVYDFYSTTSPFFGIREQDRLTAGVQWDFTVP